MEGKRPLGRIFHRAPSPAAFGYAANGRAPVGFKALANSHVWPFVALSSGAGENSSDAEIETAPPDWDCAQICELLKSSWRARARRDAAGSREVLSTVPATSIHQGEEGRGVAFERTGGAPSRREYAYRR